MFTDEKISLLMTHFGVKSVKQLEKRLGLSNGYISNLQRKGTENPGRIFVALNENGISADWLFSSGETMVLDKLKTQPFNEKVLHEKAVKTAYSSEPQKGLNDAKVLHKEASKKASPTMPELGGGSAVEKAQREALVVVDGGVEQGVLIPVIGQGVSAGLGYDYEEGEIIRYVKVPAWIARRGRDIIAMPIYGDSMDPTISNGDLAVCSSGGFCGDGVYMVRDGERGLVFCKRLLWTPGGWTVVSDNPRYEPMKIEDKSIEVVARVIAAVKEIK